MEAAIIKLTHADRPSAVLVRADHIEAVENHYYQHVNEEALEAFEEDPENNEEPRRSIRRAYTRIILTNGRELGVKEKPEEIATILSSLIGVYELEG